MYTKVKVKPVLVQAWTGPDCSQVSRQSAHEVGTCVSPYAPAAFTPLEIILVLISVRGRVDPRTTRIVQPEGLSR